MKMLSSRCFLLLCVPSVVCLFVALACATPGVDEFGATMYRNGQPISQVQSYFDGQKLDNNSQITKTFVLDDPILASGSYELRIWKSGTDGWIFHVSAEGNYMDGHLAMLSPLTDEIHFEDEVQSHSISLQQ